MDRVFDSVKKILAFVVEYVCIAYFALEKYYKEYILPYINRMRLHCWIGAAGLVALGWIAAKIF